MGARSTSTACLITARIEGGRAQLLTRTGLDWTVKYPSAVAALASINGRGHLSQTAAAASSALGA
jgi:hypothetical protein